MNTLPLRVMVMDAWDAIAMDAAPTTPVVELKRDALERAGVRRAPEHYLVKYLGAELPEGMTLADAGVVANGSLIVLSRRRTPVR